MVDFGIIERIKKQRAAGRSFTEIARDISNPETGESYHPTTISRWLNQEIKQPRNPTNIKEEMDDFDYEAAGITDMEWGENADIFTDEAAPNNEIDRNKFLTGDYGDFELPNIFTQRGHLVLRGRGTWRYIGGKFDGKTWDEQIIIRTSNKYQLPEEAQPELDEKIAERFTEMRRGDDSLGAYQILLINIDISPTSTGRDSDGITQDFVGGIEWNTDYNRGVNNE